MNHTHLLWSHLNILNKKRYDALIEQFGSLDDAWHHIDRAVLQQLRCREETITRVLAEKESIDAHALQTNLEAQAVDMLSLEDDAYPSLLRELPDPPVFLFTKGNRHALDKPCIALVGSRDMSIYGKRVTEELVVQLTRAGLTTVSGLAQGVDAHVAKETIRNAGSTIAVLGHGLGDIYPKEHTTLAQQIIEHNGLLVSRVSTTHHA